VRCGPDDDTVIADARDNIAGDCENVQLPGAGGQGGDAGNTGGNNGGQTGGSGGRNACAPVRIATKKAKLSRKGIARIRLTAGKGATCRARVTLTTIPIRRPRVRSAKVASRTTTVAAGRRISVDLRASGTARKLVKRLRRVRGRVTVVTTSATGARRTVRTAITLRG
jgi:hypothetical protein